MINRKIFLMILISLAAHVAIATVIVFIPYDMAGNSPAGHQERVIWGYVPDGSRVRPIKTGQVRPATYKIQQDKMESDKDLMPPNRLAEAFNDGDELSTPVLTVAENISEKGNDGDAGIAAIPSEGPENIPNGNPGSNDYDMNALAEHVRKEIERYKFYPDMAKLRGIEGTVYINFYIGQKGTPAGIHVVRSSGSRILDEAGMKTVAMVGTMSNIHREMRELDIMVPITYKIGK